MSKTKEYSSDVHQKICSGTQNEASAMTWWVCWTETWIWGDSEGKIGLWSLVRCSPHQAL